jgi:hypothetical protein
MLSVVTPEPHNPSHPRFREVVQQERLQEILSALGFSAVKLDDVIAGFIQSVGQHPERLEKEPYTGWSRVLVKSFPPDIPRTRIWFTYDDEHIYIEHVELLED